MVNFIPGQRKPLEVYKWHTSKKRLRPRTDGQYCKRVGKILERGDGNGKTRGKKKKNRCGVCKKKVGLTGFTCRCAGLFCSIHRYSDKHDCKFDYKVRLVLF